MSEYAEADAEKVLTSFQVRELEFEDGDAVHELLRRLHKQTYVNDELGITTEMLDERFTRRTPEERKDRLRSRLESPMTKSWVAVDNNDSIIAMVAPRIEDDGTQRLGALYVDVEWQGKGVASDLMQKALEWLDTTKDIYLGVVAYNERAKAFYRKWGFEDVPGSESLFDGMIPEIMMKREGESDEV